MMVSGFLGARSRRPGDAHCAVAPPTDRVSRFQDFSDSAPRPLAHSLLTPSHDRPLPPSMIPSELAARAYKLEWSLLADLLRIKPKRAEKAAAKREVDDQDSVATEPSKRRKTGRNDDEPAAQAVSRSTMLFRESACADMSRSRSIMRPLTSALAFGSLVPIANLNPRDDKSSSPHSKHPAPRATRGSSPSARSYCANLNGQASVSRSQGSMAYPSGRKATSPGRTRTTSIARARNKGGYMRPSMRRPTTTAPSYSRPSSTFNSCLTMMSLWQKARTKMKTTVTNSKRWTRL